MRIKDPPRTRGLSLPLPGHFPRTLNLVVVAIELAGILCLLNHLPHAAWREAKRHDEGADAVVNTLFLRDLVTHHELAAHAASAATANDVASWKVVGRPDLSPGAWCATIHADAEVSAARITTSKNSVFPSAHCGLKFFENEKKFEDLTFGLKNKNKSKQVQK